MNPAAQARGLVAPKPKPPIALPNPILPLFGHARGLLCHARGLLRQASLPLVHEPRPRHRAWPKRHQQRLSRHQQRPLHHHAPPSLHQQRRSRNRVQRPAHACAPLAPPTASSAFASAPLPVRITRLAPRPTAIASALAPYGHRFNLPSHRSSPLRPRPQPHDLREIPSRATWSDQCPPSLFTWMLCNALT